MSAPDDGSQLAALIRAMPTNAAQISIFAAGETAFPARPLAFSINGTEGRPHEGRSAIKRCAIPPASACVHRPSGNRTISAASLCVAQSLGSSDSSAASFHGSRSSLASADRTLSGISFLSMPIDPWRKSSSSGLKKEIEVAGVTVTTIGAISIRGSRLGRASTASHDRQRCAAQRRPSFAGGSRATEVRARSMRTLLRTSCGPMHEHTERCSCQGSDNTHPGIGQRAGRAATPRQPGGRILDIGYAEFPASTSRCDRIRSCIPLLRSSSAPWLVSGGCSGVPAEHAGKA
jgi:hypothetical protein